MSIVPLISSPATASSTRSLALILLALGGLSACGGSGAAKVEAEDSGAAAEGDGGDGADGTDGAADGTDGTADGADGADGSADGADGATDGTGGADGAADGAADGTTDGGDGAPPPPALPVEGAWSLVASDLTRDDCGVASFQDPAAFVAEAYTVRHIDPVTFALAADGGTPGDCLVTDGLTFTCASATLRQDLGSYGFDAEMVIETVFSGALSADRTTLDGQTDISVTCEGNCFLIEFVLDFPCPMQLDMTLTAD